MVALYRIREKVFTNFKNRVLGKFSPKIRVLYKKALQIKNMDNLEVIQKGLLKYELIQNDFNNYYSAYDKICFSAVLSSQMDLAAHQNTVVI